MKVKQVVRFDETHRQHRREADRRRSSWHVQLYVLMKPTGRETDR